MTSPSLPILTERLLLRKFEKSDLDCLVSYYSLPEVQRYLDWKVRDRVEAKAALDAMCLQHRLNRPGDTFTLAVARRVDRVVIGQVSLRWTDATAAQGELRFVFDPLYRKQGYASEAVRVMLDVAFFDFRLHRVFARCGGDNRRSAMLMRGLGMRLEAHYREHALFQGEWDEELHFAILDREWQRRAAVEELPRDQVA